MFSTTKSSGRKPSKVIRDYLETTQALTEISAGFAGVDGIAHVALSKDPTFSLAEDFVPQAINETLSLLNAAKRVPSVKRIVLTSSATAVTAGVTPRDKILTDGDWNEESIDKFNRRREEDCPFWHIYPAAKALTERAAWKFVESEKVSPLPCLLKPVIERNALSVAAVRPHHYFTLYQLRPCPR
jgi:nucleoside-diphosphate-sugar epimerase